LVVSWVRSTVLSLVAGLGPRIRTEDLGGAMLVGRGGRDFAVLNAGGRMGWRVGWAVLTIFAPMPRWQGPFGIFAVGLFGLGFGVESIADWQKWTFKSSPEGKNTWCTKVWKLTSWGGLFSAVVRGIHCSVLDAFTVL
jgi:hypothetical protein